MNKQIEKIKELTNELVFTSNYGTYNAVAEYLHNKGYRKSTDVAREILGKLTMLIKTSESQEFFKGKLSWVVESNELLDFIEKLNK